MRLMLIDWIMEVCDEFSLCRETFHLSVAYIDLFLSRQACRIDRLQLLGASALLLASKMEEFECLKVSRLVLTTDNGFTSNQIIDMERDISYALEFNLQPTTLNYLMNYYMSKWDIFARSNPQGFPILDPLYRN
jgi:hypothetical protein